MPTQSTLHRALAATVLALAAALSSPSFAYEPPHHPPGAEMGMLPAHPKHLERMLEHLLSAADAAPEQRAQIRKIAQEAAAELRPQMEAIRQERQQRMQLLTAPVVDANAMEALRQQHLAAHDVISRRSTQAWIDISRVLSQAQRIQVAERMKKHHHKMHPQDQSMIPNR
jgi:periplasmic protein CpxP/Spy